MKRKVLVAALGGAVILLIGLRFGRNSVALHNAARSGDADLVIKLIQSGMDVNQPNLEGQTPLMLAVQADKNALAVTDLLLTQGAQVNETDRYGNTALIYAAQVGDLDVVKALVEHGANMAIKNKGGATALDFAISREHFFVTEYLKGVQAKAS